MEFTSEKKIRSNRPGEGEVIAKENSIRTMVEQGN